MPNCNIFKLYGKDVPVFYECYRSTVWCSYSVKSDLQYSYKFRQKSFAHAQQACKVELKILLTIHQWIRAWLANHLMFVVLH